MMMRFFCKKDLILTFIPTKKQAFSQYKHLEMTILLKIKVKVVFFSKKNILTPLFWRTTKI